MLNHDTSTLIDSGTYGKSHSPLQSVPGGQKQRVQKISLSITNEPCQINETSAAIHCTALLLEWDPITLQTFSFAAVLRRPVKYILTQHCPFRWFLLDLKATSFHSKTSIYTGIITHPDDSARTTSACYFGWRGGGSECCFKKRNKYMRWADCNHIQSWPLTLRWPLS